uniref:Palmitoyltransferase n=1 Tax=Diabrotica virgifera virgifera TaxID=50390 RepID=A0A6P7GY48_DIAVI
MAVVTLPGYPPQDELIQEAVSICKKCISPKPPRTHHCSACNRCILKMDHHCRILFWLYTYTVLHNMFIY